MVSTHPHSPWTCLPSVQAPESKQANYTLRFKITQHGLGSGWFSAETVVVLTMLSSFPDSPTPNSVRILMEIRNIPDRSRKIAVVDSHDLNWENIYKNWLFYKQGGSVMCDGTKGSDPAYPQFWHNCLPNEEQIEKPKNYFLGNPKNPKKGKYFSKKLCMNDKIASKANNSVE